ncbi:MAG: M67 family metallopeptidase [Chloroflexota bacterium]
MTEVAHPGPRSVALSAAILQAIEAQARTQAPNEACGVIVGDGDPRSGGRSLRYVPCRNVAPSLARFRMDPDDVRRLVNETDAAGETFWAIVHSHVRTAAVPSRRDVEMAAWWPASLFVLVSLSPAEADPVSRHASLRAWRIADGVAHEIGILPESGGGA